MANMRLPSQRVLAQDRSRVRPKRVRVWRCSNCRTVYDVEPKINRITFGCPRCLINTFVRRGYVED